MSDDDIFTSGYRTTPWWWEAWRPNAEGSDDPPRTVDVAIVGAGYAGLSAALELAREGAKVVALEAKLFGEGASTRNGGAVSGGVSIGKGLSGKAGAEDRAKWARMVEAMLGDASDSLDLIDELVTREGIDCFWAKRGRFIGAYTPKAYTDIAAKLDIFNTHAGLNAHLVSREQQREEMASDYYFGGMVVERSGMLHPALYYAGLLRAARSAGAMTVAECPVMHIERSAAGFRVQTAKGDIQARDVVIATNGYTDDLTPKLKRRLVPVASHIIATEPLPEDLAKSLIPKGRTINDTRRVLTYYRMAPDGRRMLFGGRARFTPKPPEVIGRALHGMMSDRFPQLRGAKVSHVWTGNVAFAFDYLPHMGREDGMHYALACNGSGVAMMTYLGRETARKILGGSNKANAFDEREFPTMRGYSGVPWFLPAVGAWYRFRDGVDRWRATR